MDGVAEAKRIAKLMGREGPIVELPVEWARAARYRAMGETELWP
jgi:hypothetical protein